MTKTEIYSNCFSTLLKDTLFIVDCMRKLTFTSALSQS